MVEMQGGHMDAQAVLLWVLLAGGTPTDTRSGDGPTPEAAFKMAVTLASQGRYADALPLLERTDAAFPDVPNVLWNLGLVSAALDRHAKALGYWRQYRKLQPGDWRVIAKIVQEHQALNHLKERDATISELYDLRRTSKDPAVRHAERYCREQFSVGGHKVLVFEYFEPSGERGVVLRFSLVDALTDAEQAYIAFGSNELEVQIGRELGQIGKGDRSYYLDFYEAGRVRTLALFQARPSYETLRARVTKELTGERRPAPALRSPPAPAQRGDLGGRPR